MPFFALLISIFAAAAYAQDRYKNFAELATYEREGVDYQIRVNDIDADISVFAVHGGKIEPLTSVLTLEVAGNRHNYYLFEGIKPRKNWDLHVTSPNFDEPCALQLAAKSLACVSIHAFKEPLKSTVCLGGLNESLMDLIFKHLNRSGVIDQKEKNPCGKFWANTRSNIVNRCVEGGAQIEVSTYLMRSMSADPQLRRRFVEALRNAIEEYQGSV